MTLYNLLKTNYIELPYKDTLINVISEIDVNGARNIKEIFPDTKNGFKDLFSNTMELDIYIPSLKIAIEYDGYFWHKNKENKDLQKNKKYSYTRNINMLQIKLE